MKDLILTILVSKEGIYVTRSEHEDGEPTNSWALNERFDKTSIDIQNVNSEKVKK